jgi:hypothetical protein
MLCRPQAEVVHSLQMAEATGRSLTENDRQLNHQAGIISSMVVVFGFILFLNAIQASIMLYHSLRVNIYPNWNSVKWRLLVDTIMALVLYAVLLYAYRYNRYDCPGLCHCFT